MADERGTDDRMQPIEENDDDLRLIALLAEEAQRAQPGAPARPAPPRRFTVSAGDHLDVFRETQRTVRRPRVLEQIEIDDVDIADLVEQLATTAAALRRRHRVDGARAA
jgi:hypothetical protein